MIDVSLVEALGATIVFTSAGAGIHKVYSIARGPYDGLTKRLDEVVTRLEAVSKCADKHDRLLVEADSESTATIPAQVIEINRRLQAHLDEHVAQAARWEGKLDAILAHVRPADVSRR